MTQPHVRPRAAESTTAVNQRSRDPCSSTSAANQLAPRAFPHQTNPDVLVRQPKAKEDAVDDVTFTGAVRPADRGEIIVEGNFCLSAERLEVVQLDRRSG